MIATVVVDVGNTRVKWGRCAGDQVTEMASLPHGDETAWQAQLDAWRVAAGSTWALCGVHPRQRDQLSDWLTRRAQRVLVLDSFRQLPVRVDVDHPDKVGLDRLLNAVAFNGVRKTDEAGVLVGAGTAATVDYVDSEGVFRGGAILPGRRLMARALHDHTALLPMLGDDRVEPGPGKNTESAMRLGITSAVVGAIERLFQDYSSRTTGSCRLFLTGGDAPYLSTFLGAYLTTPEQLWMKMTLEGIRRSAASRETP